MNNKIKLLYIDDETLNVQLFEYNFKKKYNVITGYSGEDGLKLLEENPDIKIVISDMKMPRMSGLEFIRIAKEKYSDKKYFILTGYDITDEIHDAIESLLILQYFKKPFNIREIEAAINSIS